MGCLVKLGLAGVGQTASEWWSWELNNCAYIGMQLNNLDADMCFDSGRQSVCDQMYKESNLLTFIHSLGPTALAAQSILLISSTFTFQAPFALSLATSVRYVV